MATAILGITGGIGMGKSTAAMLLRSSGVPVVDTDDLARGLVVPGSDALAEIAACFGPGMILTDGSLDRASLAQRVFRDPNDRQALESILHPRIHALWRAQADAWKLAGTRIGCVVIPLLFEKGYAPEFDAVVAVVCSRGSQSARIAERGWSASELERRESAQWGPEKKAGASRYVVWTEGTLEVHRRQWERILARVDG
jgi:dephospho-CoA kinase